MTYKELYLHLLNEGATEQVLSEIPDIQYFIHYVGDDIHGAVANVYVILEDTIARLPVSEIKSIESGGEHFDLYLMKRADKNELAVNYFNMLKKLGRYKKLFSEYIPDFIDETSYISRNNDWPNKG